jgi:hypothetical protein
MTAGQLAAAISFVHTHRIAFITIDIGGNDIDNCIAITGIDSTCFSNALTTVVGNLPQILAALRSAAGREQLPMSNSRKSFLTRG